MKKLATTSQRLLPIKLETKAPLMDINMARAILEKEREEILALVDDSKIAWVFDIGLGGNRSELRLFSKCVRGYQTTGTKCGLEDQPLAFIIAQILGREVKPFIKGRRLAQLFGCERKLIIDLIEAGALKIVKGTDWRRGRGGSPLVTRESVVEFLTKRRSQ